MALRTLCGQVWVSQMISEDEELKILVKTYNNTKVRAGEKITNTRMHTKGLIEYIYDKIS